ncbi:MAG: tRNA uridine-5-carboxymethylaminomethyl(34) synthesis GTPase MnmE [Betaproteobacteria bacterium]
MSGNVSRGTADTIVAIATPPGRGGIGVVRLSGPDVKSLVGAVVAKPLAPRSAVYTAFLDEDGSSIDEGIALFFPAPNSYTGEDVIELQGHGGPTVMARILKRCVQLGCRLARPGEFTERAFLNDKLDLAQAESVADLIEAGSEAAAKSAARTLTGEFSRRVHQITDELINLRMHVEACIDFPEEEIDPDERVVQENKLKQLSALLGSLSQEARKGTVLRDGLTVVLIGRPNVGKSSLLNRLAGEDLAIVTPVAGTTRDHVRATIYLEGVPIHLIDTAGLRDTDDVVEKVGIDRTWSAISNAGAALLIAEAGEMAGVDEAQILHRLPAALPVAWVYNKIDLYQASSVSRETSREGNQLTLFVSALTGEGTDTLRAWLLETAGWTASGEGAFLARERHMIGLRAASDHLEAAGKTREYALFAEELRLAQLALAAITGEFAPDDLLGEIFGRFCIGK